MKLEIGMYVRTKNGCICQILRTTYSKYLSRNKELCYEVDRPINVNMELYDEDIFKASHNITDLIEVGDYIRITTSAFYEPVYYSYGKLVIRDDIDISKYTNKFIAEVITHEQIKSMSYKVERG